MYISRLESELKTAKLSLRLKIQSLYKKDQLISDLRLNIAQLQDLLKTTQVDSELQNSICKIFSPKQIERLKQKTSMVHWTDDDISKAIALDSISSKAYNYLRDIMKYPFPSRSTIKRWLTQIQIRPGILQSVLNLLTVNFEHASPMQTICTMAFDEMGIDSSYCYDEKPTYNNKVYSPWMQPIWGGGVTSKHT